MARFLCPDGGRSNGVPHIIPPGPCLSFCRFVCLFVGLFVFFLCVSLCLPVSKSAVRTTVGLAKCNAVFLAILRSYSSYAPPIRASISRPRQEHAGTCGRKMKAGRWVAASFSLPRAQEGAAPVGTLHCMQVIPEAFKRIVLESTS